VKYLMSMGKQVPQTLLQQIARDKQQEVNEDSFNKNAVRSESQQMYYPPSNRPPSNRPPSNRPPSNRPPSNRPPSNNPPSNRQQPPNIYSPQYAAYIGARPRAQISARIGMGGTY